MGTHALAPAFYPNLGYDPEKDFEPIGLIAEQPELLTVRKDFPANNLKEFVAYAKANESKLNMAHAGVGSVSYVGCLLLNSAIGIKPTMVPFTGTAPVMNAILAGTRSTTIAIRCSGRCRMCAPAPPRRSPSPPRSAARCLPDVPTSVEQGLPEFDCAPFYARVRAQGHAEGRSSTSWRTRSTRGWRSPPCKSASPISAPKSPSRSGADRRHWANWSRARSRGSRQS